MEIVKDESLESKKVIIFFLKKKINENLTSY